MIAIVQALVLSFGCVCLLMPAYLRACAGSLVPTGTL
ncbi:MAG: hypothetical protein RL715_795 [Chloroflexota bacterium]